MKLTFAPAFPKALQKSIEATLKPYRPLVETKLDILYVAFDTDANPEDRQAIAAVLTNREYKQAQLLIFPKFLILDEAEQEASLVHELTHVLVAPFRDECFRLIEYYIPEMNTRNYVAEILSEKEEFIVTEVSAALVDFRRGEA